MKQVKEHLARFWSDFPVITISGSIGGAISLLFALFLTALEGNYLSQIPFTSWVKVMLAGAVGGFCLTVVVFITISAAILVVRLFRLRSAKQ